MATRTTVPSRARRLAIALAAAAVAVSTLVAVPNSIAYSGNGLIGRWNIYGKFAGDSFLIDSMSTTAATLTLAT